MSNVELCLLLNLLILIAFGYEIWNDLDIIEDKKESPARRRKFALRFTLSSITVCIALLIIYTVLGVSTNELIECVV